ncbi:serine/threonine protein kinase [Streptomyces sp. OF3]|uniref:Serine/threonine protein kinase n=1 Tax=Streptomyces alkaliterrae TaxID=2213162 RepID=A0A7W3WN35_9ACTN|nr:serine/threonine protein kinase [Streptomyces alkaliterrae]MBB1255376.1 serine/threonine protein kinase [Streptomyces alkaliterrae]
MAERSTAAVDVAGASGGESGGQNPRRQSKPASDTTADGTRPQPGATPPELHSGHKLARRYRLEECTTRLDGFSSWRAVDEMLRRAVGVHVLPADHSRARSVLAAARSAALLGDPRFVQVLDAVEENDLVYVVHEWLADATPLTELLESGPLEPYEAYQMVTQVSQGMAAAHREGLSHLRLIPSAVLRTGVGQYRIRGLAVNAALRGISADNAARTDTEAIGALLYAAVTQRWPYEEDAYGLAGVPPLAGGGIVPADQVRAGVHRGLAELAMRALVNNGATASSREQPCTTPQEIVTAVAALPRIKPPEPEFPAAFGRAGYGGYSAGPYGPPGGYPPKTTRAAANAPTRPVQAATAPEPPPTLPGRTGKLLKGAVSALLIAALGLGSWQVADALMNGGDNNSTGGAAGQEEEPPEQTKENEPKPDTPTGKSIKVAKAKDFDPQGRDRKEKPADVPKALDGNPSTYWQTDYYGNATFGNLKDGVGIILDLGDVQQVSTLKVSLQGSTGVDFLATPRTVTSMPNSLSDFGKVTGGSGESVVLKAEKPIKTRFVLVWLTELPINDGQYRARVTTIEVTS